ncbi:MAG TPA: dienelactone hydrolase family protein [Steroidobacteraceae bacterium]|jgi:carboxymethylenebutenolidase|nr:dienelactone hydrolase family protein [Steroidobacteraceae bacterium]
MLMGHAIDLTAADGHRLSGYLAEPTAEARGGIVVVQEIFGVTRHIRAVADQYAAAGFLALAPALFDRLERNVDVPYSDMQKGRGYMQAMDDDKVMLDLAAGVERVSSAGKVGMVGYCWGGTLAFLAAAKLKIDAAAAYYGGGIERHLEQKPKAPVLFHFGEKDAHIPPSAVAKIEAAYPQGIYYLYPAEHGFNCSDRASYEPKSANLAFERTLEFLHRHIG